MSIPRQYPLDKYSRACDQLKTPVYMLGLGVALLRQYFGNDDRIALEKSQYLWSDDQEASQLYIGWGDNLDYQTIGKRPAVVVSMGDFSFPKKVIADRMFGGQPEGGHGILDYTEGEWIVTCLADKALEAWGLATEVKYFIQTYRTYIASAYDLFSVRTEGIGKYDEQKDYKPMYGSPVSVKFGFQDNFEVNPHALRIAAINLRLHTEN